MGIIIKLYRAEMVKGPLALRKHLEKYNTDLGVEYVEYSLIEEYLE